MSTKRLRRPRDPIQLGKLIVDIATGQADDRAPAEEESPASNFAKKGDKARAAKLSAKRGVRGVKDTRFHSHACSDPASPNPPALQQTDASQAMAILACLFCARRSRAGERNRPRRIDVRNWNSISGAKNRSVSAKHRITGGSKCQSV